MHRVFRTVRPLSRVGRIVACLIPCALLCVLPAFSQADDPQASTIASRAAAPRLEERMLDIEPAVPYRWQSAIEESPGSFWDRRFMPAVERRMNYLSAIHLQRSVTGTLTDDLFYEQATREARHGLERATRLAFETLILEETSLGRLHDRIRGRVDRARSKKGNGEGRGSRFDFDLGISRSLPRFEITYGLERANVTLTVKYDGMTRLEYSRLNTRTRISARYDPWDDRYSLGCVLPF